MRELLVIGIGPATLIRSPSRRCRPSTGWTSLPLIDKGNAKSGLNAVRDEILKRHVSDLNFRIVEIPEPPRDRSPSLGNAAYEGAVQDWHEARARRIGTALAAELADDGVGAFLVWGDPSVYDSTLRVIDRIVASGVVEFEYAVIPGVTSVQALAAAHRIPLNRIGEPIYITPARRIADGLPEGLDSAVVMLDSGFTAAVLDEPGLTSSGRLPSHRRPHSSQDGSKSPTNRRGPNATARRAWLIMDTYRRAADARAALRRLSCWSARGSSSRDGCPEALRGQHVADDDDGRAPDTRSVHLRRDVAERAAKDHLTGWLACATTATGQSSP
jgi:precorrin-6A synthase